MVTELALPKTRKRYFYFYLVILFSGLFDVGSEIDKIAFVEVVVVVGIVE